MPQLNKPIGPGPPEAQFFSINEAALVLGVRRKFIKTWVAEGLLPALQVGFGDQIVRICRQDLDVFIQEHDDLLTAARKESG